MKIIIGATLSIPPFSSGMAFNWLQHVIGFQKLGHEVYFLEEVKPKWCVDKYGRPCEYMDSANRVHFQSTMEQFGLLAQASQIFNCGEATCGLSYDSVIAVTKEADLLINISGHVADEAILSSVENLIYVDQDPVYTQLWAAAYGKDLNFEMHDVFLSVGLKIGTPYTSIPDCGVKWRHTLPPLIMEFWPVSLGDSCKPFTTIASWSGYGDLYYEGEWYRSKYEEFKRFAELPRRVGQDLEVALRRHSHDDEGIQLLKANGWRVTEASQLAALPDYRSYIARSRAEIGIAKNAYVKGDSGWFSDRSAHYLASGKPVLAQSTGFERCFPVGQGLITFSSMEEAVAGINAINQDYEAHCLAAREFAQEYLDYRRVLPRMLEACTTADIDPLSWTEQN
jgi:hypothetical protein